MLSFLSTFDVVLFLLFLSHTQASVAVLGALHLLYLDFYKPTVFNFFSPGQLLLIRKISQFVVQARNVGTKKSGISYFLSLF